MKSIPVLASSNCNNVTIKCRDLCFSLLLTNFESLDLVLPCSIQKHKSNLFHLESIKYENLVIFGLWIYLLIHSICILWHVSYPALTRSVSSPKEFRSLLHCKISPFSPLVIKHRKPLQSDSPPLDFTRKIFH